jgi:hypothetical protein
MNTLQGAPRMESKEVLMANLKRFLHKHQKEEVLVMRAGRSHRPDCATVANGAVKPIQDSFGKSLSEVSTLSVDEKSPIKIFQRSGFSNHVINYIMLQDGSFLAFDLTAKYNLPNQENEPIKYFAADSIEKLKSQLQAFYGTTRKWTTLNE